MNKEIKKLEKSQMTCSGEYLKIKDGLLNILNLALSVEKVKKDSDKEKVHQFENVICEIKMSRSKKYPEAV